MARFNSIEYFKDSQTLKIGAGCLFDDVYKELAKVAPGRAIVGGDPVRGVGVASYYLHGGYCRLSNVYGLGFDNIVEYGIVPPKGESPYVVTGKSDKDLFWALKVT